MEAEDGNGSFQSGKTSWLLGLICPCLSSNLGSPETKPMRWFQVENGQLQSVPKKKLTKRQKRSNSTDARKRAENYTVVKDAQNNPSPIIINKESSEFDWSTRWGTTSNVLDTQKNRDTVSDFRKQPVFSARELSAQSSDAHSCDDETPPLLRSDGDPYQPYVIMEIANASCPETESERMNNPSQAHEIPGSENDDEDKGGEQTENV
ncbi:uncharacterized protein [Asterias amurensis]|uniref:uncharacterized protein n=1 Tax=Asterias amurensis TaxID=7602 RepID=UPI003AB21BA8